MLTISTILIRFSRNHDTVRAERIAIIEAGLISKLRNVPSCFSAEIETEASERTLVHKTQNMYAVNSVVLVCVFI